MPELVGYRLRRPEMIRLVLFALAVAAVLAAYFHWVPGLELIFWVAALLLVVASFIFKPQRKYHSPSTRGH